jgi:hypothetical protein
VEKLINPEQTLKVMLSSTDLDGLRRERLLEILGQDGVVVFDGLDLSCLRRLYESASDGRIDGLKEECNDDFEVRKYADSPRTTLRVHNPSTTRLQENGWNDYFDALRSAWVIAERLAHGVDATLHNGTHQGRYLLNFQQHHYGRPKKDFRLGEHIDGLNALIFPATEGGLEMLWCGQWQSVNLAEDQCAFVPGKAAFMSTNTIVQPIKHRVRALGDTVRYAGVFGFRRN